MYIPMPMFILRRIVRRNPWLLAERGAITRAETLRIWPFELEIQGEMELPPKQKAKLQAEAAAGKLFKR